MPELIARLGYFFMLRREGWDSLLWASQVEMAYCRRSHLRFEEGFDGTAKTGKKASILCEKGGFLGQKRGKMGGLQLLIGNGGEIANY
ncbi:MAG: hypothetical protein ABR907_07360 [Terracidiphilus sp.]